jgi:hypothetical protein
VRRKKKLLQRKLQNSAGEENLNKYKEGIFVVIEIHFYLFLTVYVYIHHCSVFVCDANTQLYGEGK